MKKRLFHRKHQRIHYARRRWGIFAVLLLVFLVAGSFSRRLLFKSQPALLFYTDLKTGKEARINTAIVKSSSLDYPYENTTNTFESRFKGTFTDQELVHVTQGNHLFSFSIPINQTFGTLNKTDAVVEANTIVYPQVFPGSDIRYTVTPQQLLEEYVMTSPEVASGVDALAQRMTLTGMQAIVNLDGSVTIKDEHNVPVFTLPKPVLYEDRYHNTRSYGITYSVTTEGDATILTKTLTPEGKAWLSHPKRRYPIVLDAAVTVATTDSNSGTAFSFQNKMFYDTMHNRYWAFYYDGSAIAYSYSTDGITWSSGGTLSYNTYDFSISYKDIAGTGTVYVATTCGTTGSVCVTKGTMGESSISWGAESTVLTGTHAAIDTYNRVTIALDANNIIWVAARHQTPGVLTAQYYRQVYTTSSLSENDPSVWLPATPVGPKDFMLDTLILLPKTGSNMALIVKGSQENHIVSYQFSDSSWTWECMNSGGDYEWFTYGRQNQTNGEVRAVVLADDDSGYIGGNFTAVGNMAVNYIVKWDDNRGYTALGGGTNGAVYSIAVSGTTVYAAGSFTSAGGVTVNRIAKWNGVSWSALGGGVATGTVQDVAIAPDGSVYICGDFLVAGGVTVNRVAKWNGTSWGVVGTSVGAQNTAYSLAIAADGTVYLGGGFTSVTGVTGTNRLAKWNGTSWSAVGSGGFNGTVNTLDIGYEGILYAGGQFTTAGGKTVNRIAMWNGTSWSALGSGTNATVYAVSARPNAPDLWVAGTFTVIGGVNAARVARWNGTSWDNVGTGVNNTVGGTNALDVTTTNELFIGGNFTTAGSLAIPYLARYKSTTGGWGSLNANMGLNGEVYAYAVSSDGTVYAGGNFTTAGGSAMNYIVKWNGTDWSALGSGTNGIVRSLALDSDGALYAGGDFTVADSVTVNRIAKWNGLAWTELGAGTNGIVRSLALDSDGALYAGGDFGTAGGVTVNRIAKWNGASWSALGAGANNVVNTVFVASDNTVYIGGTFTAAGGVTVNRIAKWNGASWSALGGGANSTVNTVSVSSDNTVYIGGAFGTAGGVTVNRIAKWNGASWSTLGGMGGGSTADVYALTFDATGALYACGNFTTAGGTTVNRIAKWNGASWSALSGGLSYVNSTGIAYTCVFGADGVLRVGGTISVVNTVSTSYMAVWAPAVSASTQSSQEVYALSDGSGNIHVVFVDPSGFIGYKQYNGTSWGAKVGLFAMSGFPATNPILLRDVEGYLYAFFLVGNTIYYRRGTPPYDSQSWNVLDDPVAFYDVGTNIFMTGSSGNNGILLAWLNGTANPYSVVFDKLVPTPTQTPTPTPGLSSNYTVNDDMSWTPMYDDGSRPTPSRKAGGVDNGTGITNTASITVKNGVLLVQDKETLVAGSLILQGGSIAINQGATIKIGHALFAQDQDMDGYPLEQKVYYQAVTPTPLHGKRLSAMTTMNTQDCNDTNITQTTSCCVVKTLYRDFDGDGYGNPNVSSNRCIESGWVENNTDCKDSGVRANLVWATASCYLDLDNDDYGTTTAFSCTDNATCTLATAGAVDAVSDAFVASFSTLNTDCCDRNNLAYPGSTQCSSTALAGCSPEGGQYDYNCNGASSACGGGTYGTWSGYGYKECVSGVCDEVGPDIGCYSTTPPACGATRYTKSSNVTTKQSCSACGDSNVSCYTAQAAGKQTCN